MTSKTMADIITAHLDMTGDEYDLRYIAAIRRLANDVQRELSAAGFGLVADAGSLRTELVEYVKLLEHLDANDEGIDGDAVPRELRDILKRTAEASS